MQLKQDIKGFTILELLVVIVIISIISAVSYPNFMDWRKDREVRAAAEKVASMLTGINTQAQRGSYPFVQFQVKPLSGSVQFRSKGMSQDKMNSKLNQATTKILDCELNDSGYWDNHTVDIYEKDVGVHISKTSAIYFSKDGSYFSEKNRLEDSQVTNITLAGRTSNNYLIICLPKSGGGGLVIIGGGSGACGIDKPQYL